MSGARVGDRKSSSDGVTGGERADPGGPDPGGPGSGDASAVPDGHPGGTGSGLVRVTVNLTPRSMHALERVSSAVGETKTDAINRALQVYAFLWEALEQEGAHLVLKHRDGETERIRFL